MKLLDVARDALRTKHYAHKTEKTYLHWIKQYVRFLNPIHPKEFETWQIILEEKT